MYLIFVCINFANHYNLWISRVSNFWGRKAKFNIRRGCRTSNFVKFLESPTAWKVSQYGVSSGQYFSAFGLNTERHGKIRTRNNSVFGLFSRSDHEWKFFRCPTVSVTQNWKNIINYWNSTQWNEMKFSEKWQKGVKMLIPSESKEIN